MSMFPSNRDRERDLSAWMQAELLERRTVMVSAALDDDAVAGLAAQLMMLDAAGDDAIHLHIDSAGGTLDATTAIVDVLDLLGVPVHADCVGRAEGPALVMLAVADRRVASPHSSLRLHEPPDDFQGRATELESWMQRRAHQLDALCARLAEATKLSTEAIARDMERGRYLTPREAVDAGLIDEIAAPSAQIHHLRRNVGFRHDR